jgi:hypothetical protein
MVKKSVVKTSPKLVGKSAPALVVKVSNVNALTGCTYFAASEDLLSAQEVVLDLHIQSMNMPAHNQSLALTIPKGSNEVEDSILPNQDVFFTSTSVLRKSVESVNAKLRDSMEYKRKLNYALAVHLVELLCHRLSNNRLNVLTSTKHYLRMNAASYGYTRSPNASNHLELIEEPTRILGVQNGEIQIARKNRKSHPDKNDPNINQGGLQAFYNSPAIREAIPNGYNIVKKFFDKLGLAYNEILEGNLFEILSKIPLWSVVKKEDGSVGNNNPKLDEGAKSQLVLQVFEYIIGKSKEAKERKIADANSEGSQIDDRVTELVSEDNLSPLNLHLKIMCGDDMSSLALDKFIGWWNGIATDDE